MPISNFFSHLYRLPYRLVSSAQWQRPSQKMRNVRVECVALRNQKRGTVQIATRSSAMSVGKSRFPIKKGKLVDGMPHEKTNQKVVKQLKAILEPPDNQEELWELHRRDEDTTWFGVLRNPNPDPITGLTRTSFKDYGRYAALMAETRPPNGEMRYPQLVSFIGQTSEYFFSPNNVNES